ncbi:hypothetical protein [Shigella boydii]|uniref:hypothetical protein n=1 Tax=Shigella boydii TaxID=621 RepID=UPI0011BAC90F|nr:hypothetical protein [Shigella boydii]
MSIPSAFLRELLFHRCFVGVVAGFAPGYVRFVPISCIARALGVGGVSGGVPGVVRAGGAGLVEFVFHFSFGFCLVLLFVCFLLLCLYRI